jgi:hypothetical protein
MPVRKILESASEFIMPRVIFGPTKNVIGACQKINQCLTNLLYLHIALPAEQNLAEDRINFHT